jgi:hypothetical protein
MRFKAFMRIVNGTSAIWIGTIKPIRIKTNILPAHRKFIWVKANAAIASMVTPRGTLISVIIRLFKK